MTRRVEALVVVCMLTTACSSSSPQAAPSPTVSGQPLPAAAYLVLAIAPAAPGRMTTVEMVGMNGAVVAKADFTAPPKPSVPGCDSIVQPVVRAAGTAAFFADSGGTVRRVDPTGAVTAVATFKLTSPQQFLSFAVSPDGKKLIASIITVPAASGHWTLDIESADSGGPVKSVMHSDLGGSLPRPIVVSGWDHFGPTATTGTVICTRDDVPSHEYSGNSLVHLGADGSVLDQIGGSACVPMDELADGTALCRSGQDDCQSFTVRRQDGTALWGRVPGCSFFEPRLSPDANAVALNGAVSLVYLRNVAVPASFAREQASGFTEVGWAGPRSLLVARQDGELGFVPSSNPLAFADLGLNIGSQCIGCVPDGLYLAGTLLDA